MPNEAMSGMEALTTIIIIFSVLSYVLFAIGLHTIGERNGIDNAYFAWIPVLQFYVLGAVVDEKLRWVLPGLLVATFLLEGVPILGTLMVVLTFIVFFITLYMFLEMHNAPFPAGIVFISLFVPIVLAYVVFVSRHD